MRFFKKMIYLLSMMVLMVSLSGCGTDYMTNPPPIEPNSGGFWDRYFVYPLSWLLDESAIILGGSYGLGILATTVIIRLAVLPLMIKQLKSSKAMQALQPELQKIKDKYKDQQKIQEETLKLFQKYNVNPLAGCLPILVQMPILIAFYQAIMRNSNVREHDFLWMALGQPDPFYVLPILAAITTYFQSKMMGTGMPNNPQMQMMLVIMPIMILVIAVTLPSALSLYWVFGNIFTIIQTFFIKGNQPVPAQEVNKK